MKKHFSPVVYIDAILFTFNHSIVKEFVQKAKQQFIGFIEKVQNNKRTDTSNIQEVDKKKRHTRN
jgi:hypothetical protein